MINMLEQQSGEYQTNQVYVLVWSHEGALVFFQYSDNNRMKIHSAIQSTLQPDDIKNHFHETWVNFLENIIRNGSKITLRVNEDQTKTYRMFMNWALVEDLMSGEINEELLKDSFIPSGSIKTIEDFFHMYNIKVRIEQPVEMQAAKVA